MNMQDIETRGLVVLGCGKMGSAMLQGWLAGGVPAGSVWVVDPKPAAQIVESGVHVNAELPASPAIVVVAVKPQMMDEALPGFEAMGGGRTLFLSVAAGTSLSFYEERLGAGTPIIRAMPNTPAAVGKGITAIIGNAAAGPAHLDLAEALMQAVGQVVRLEREDQMDAVTGLSGSGPAYVFHLIEAMAAAGEEQGLPAPLAMQLARATVAGAGALAESSQEGPGQLRINVTSPKGTTEAALRVLMDPQSGFGPLLRRAVAAAADRSRELGK